MSHTSLDISPLSRDNKEKGNMVWLSHWFDWRHAVRIVKPETFTR
jgi:hypothetical protein